MVLAYMSDLLDRPVCGRLDCPVCGRLSHGVAGLASSGADTARLLKQLLILSNLQRGNKHSDVPGSRYHCNARVMAVIHQ